MRKVNKRLVRLGVAAVMLLPLCVLTLAGCKQEVSWISADPKSIELAKMDETFQIKAVALDKENKPVKDAQLIWTSSEPKVVEVSATGILTAKGSGNSMVTVSSPNGEKAVVQVKVSILGAIEVTPSEVQLKVGEKQKLETRVLNERGELFEDQVVGWACDNPDIVFIDDLGELTAMKPGEATVTATTPSKELVHVYGRAKITVLPAGGAAEPAAPPAQ